LNALIPKIGCNTLIIIDLTQRGNQSK